MRVALGIGVAMVLPVPGGPPEWALLHGGEAAEREDELCEAADLEGTVREQTVVATGDEENSYEVKDAEQRDVGGVHAGEHRQQGDEVTEQKRRRSAPRNGVGRSDSATLLTGR